MSNAPLSVVEFEQPGAIQALPQATPSYLLQLAVQQGADLDKLERLMALQERWEANEARKAFTSAMARFKSDPITIYKNKSVGYTNKDGSFVGYSHAELSDVTSAVCPALARNGLSHNWKIHQDAGYISVDCVITHELGHAESITMSGPPDVSGKKNAIQQVASTITYLQRYTLLAITGLSAQGVDDDGHGYDDRSEAEPTQAERHAAQHKPAAAPGLPNVSEGYINKWIDGWAKKILDGSNTTESLIATLQTKYTLTAAEIERIKAIPAKYSGVTA